ncbi:hypothetical protein BH18ACT14_BH18ACT14_08130 [soil metagenome]
MPDSAQPPESNSSGKGGFLTFWTTLPGILTGIAALITAIVGLATFLHSGKNTASTASPEQSLAETAISTTAATTSNSGSSGPAGTIKEGRLALGRGDAADLEHGVIGFTSNDDIMFGPESTPYLYASDTAFLAPIQTPPSKRACESVLSQRRAAFESIPELLAPWVCVSTSEGHVANVKIVRTPGVGSAQLLLKYTVWQ